jgi:Raf kinase inhibitor-like YbhB/YbcL family protein
VTTRQRRWLAAGFAGAVALGAASGEDDMRLSSSAFRAGSAIPARHTCDGEDASPPLAWSDPPAGTKSFALVVDDPDAPDPKAPRTVWVHWVVYDLPADARGLREGVRGAEDLPRGARVGKNDWGKAAWGGPCPPVGRHRYFFELYALDVALGDRGAPGKRELEAAMQGHVLARAELVGTYERGR